MGKKRADADSRRFFDEFEMVRVCRFRATGVIDPARNVAVIPMGGKDRLISTKHTRFWNGGGFSFFVCPRCGKRASNLWLVEDAPLCRHCCEKLNIRCRSRWGLTRADRARACDIALDRMLERLNSPVPLRHNPAPPSWGGRAQACYNTRRLTRHTRRRMIQQRLRLLADQNAGNHGGEPVAGKRLSKAANAKLLVDLDRIWKANTQETLERALDEAQTAVLQALNHPDPQIRLIAAKLTMRTRQASQRGLR